MQKAKRIHAYQAALQLLLTREERAVFQKLSTPQKVQDYLDTLTINFEESGEDGLFSPRRVLREGKAHCAEAALFAAAALVYHGREPLLLDFQTIPSDEDHVVTLFVQDGYWGAISKTNHAVLRYRDPVYKSVRELAMSYFHEYFLTAESQPYIPPSKDGLKSMRAYSKPFSLLRYAPHTWVTAEEDLFWLIEDDLNNAPHESVATPAHIRRLRPASKIEREAFKLTEWKPKKTR